MNNLAIIGTTQAILGMMFPDRHEHHVVLWRHWKWLYDRNIVDRAGIVLVGRQRGYFFRDWPSKHQETV